MDDAVSAHGLAQILRAAGMPVEERLAGSTGPLTDLAYDSRAVTPGSCFFCLPGGADDGHRYARAALAAGAVALVCQQPLEVPAAQLVVPDARRAMNLAAAPFFGNPSRRLAAAGFTGTNGKTTATFMLESIWGAAGLPSGLIGTVESRIGGVPVSHGGRTTPESVDLQRLLARMVAAGVGHVAIEVTSIGLAQGRITGTTFAVAAFTNLTQDHLDYHGDLESYFQAKRALFSGEYLPESGAGQGSVALINADDDHGARLAAELSAGPLAGRVVTYGVDAPADVRATDVAPAGGGSRFRMTAGGSRLAADEWVTLPLPGRFNVSNALAAGAAALALGVPAGVVAHGLDALPPVPGRFQRVDAGQDFAVVVDYAHTPDGLARVLAAARSVAGEARVAVVFGAGGDRDRAKRPLMGQAAAAGADTVIVTSDNPRGEDPAAIMAGIEAGIAPSPPRGGFRLIADRAEAIAHALAAARTGDVVVIAGKGHEATQTFADRVVPFDDRAVATELLRRLRGAGAPQDGSSP
ncbi:MAG TPA: UDP-N-acetylmuramoyl-L-alanyl-D-glutamate--2,6-diaminopimelate ligase [Actinomycetota bacterium]|nr:UDP-N-acetylmuramoyl-L-alanyl-D-glutamate--2,6-diaminopimelate ligase [Actinomycetota bacterium]